MLKINNNLDYYKNICEAVKRFNLISLQHLYYYMYIEGDLYNKYLQKYNDVQHLGGVDINNYFNTEHVHYNQQQSFIRRIKKLSKFETEHGRLFNITENRGKFYISLTNAGEKLTSEPKTKEYTPSLNQTQHYDLIAYTYLAIKFGNRNLNIITDVEIKKLYKDKFAKPDLLMPTIKKLVEVEKNYKGERRMREKILNLESSFPGYDMIWITDNKSVINFLKKYKKESQGGYFAQEYKIIIKTIRN